MTEPHFTRPRLPEGYLANPKGFVAWSHVETRLRESKNYWLCTVGPKGRPHAIPRWGVWVNGKIYFDGSPQTRHARNMEANPYVSVHLESGDDVVAVDGLARAHPKPSPELGRQLADAYAAKYAVLGYSPQPDQWDNGGLYEVTPTKVLAWTKFTEDPTRFTF